MMQNANYYQMMERQIAEFDSENTQCGRKTVAALLLCAMFQPLSVDPCGAF